MRILIPFMLLALSCSSAQEGLDRSSASSRSALYESDDENCGAEGYACVGGRTCSDSRCTPAWLEMGESGAPDPRGAAAAGFLNGKYVVFGGCTSTSGTPAAVTSGGSYDPTMDAWSSLPALSTGRAQFSAVTTDFGVYAYGGLSVCFSGSAEGPDLEVLFDTSGSWTDLPATGNPSGRYNPAFAWDKSDDGSGLFVFGGSDNVHGQMATGNSISLGENWRNIDCPLAGCQHGGAFSSFFDDGVMHVWGGGVGGLLFDTKNSRWYDWTVPDGTPDFGSIQTAIGATPRYADDGRRLYYISSNDDVLIFDRKTQSWSTDSQDVPSGFCAEGATTWSGTEMITWSGLCDSSLSSVGARYQPPAP